MPHEENGSVEKTEIEFQIKSENDENSPSYDVQTLNESHPNISVIFVKLNNSSRNISLVDTHGYQSYLETPPAANKDIYIKTNEGNTIENDSNFLEKGYSTTSANDKHDDVNNSVIGIQSTLRELNPLKKNKTGNAFRRSNSIQHFKRISRPQRENVNENELNQQDLIIYNFAKVDNIIRRVYSTQPTSRTSAKPSPVASKSNQLNDSCTKPCHKRDARGVCRLVFGCTPFAASTEEQSSDDPQVGASIIGANGCAKCHLSDYSGKCRVVLSCMLRSGWSRK